MLFRAMALWGGGFAYLVDKKARRMHLPQWRKSGVSSSFLPEKMNRHRITCALFLVVARLSHKGDEVLLPQAGILEDRAIQICRIVGSFAGLSGLCRVVLFPFQGKTLRVLPARSLWDATSGRVDLREGIRIGGLRVWLATDGDPYSHAELQAHARSREQLAI